MKNKKTTLDRREFIRLNTAAFASALLTPALVAGTKPQRETTASTGTEPVGFYRFALGDVEITVLSDGYFHFPMELVAIDDPLDMQAYGVERKSQEAFFRSRLVPFDHIPLQASPVLIDAGDHRTLVDCGFGAGEEVPPNVGRLRATLEAAGVAPESVDTVILTHAHPDHIGGLLNPATGGPAFPNAEVVLSEEELSFWIDDDPTSVLEPAFVAEAVLAPARGVLTALEDRLRTVRVEAEVTNGIRTIPSPGHTPGHVSVAVEGGGRQLLLTGDAIVFTHVSFEHPEWRLFTDLDREGAGRTRRRLLDRAAADEMLLLGFHFPFPGLGYALRHEDAYRWHPAGWTVLQ